MNKGFTLIEVLTVIILLSVISLIAVPEITKMVDNSNSQTFLESVNGVYRTIYNDAVDNDGKVNVIYKYKNNTLVRSEDGVTETIVKVKNKIRDGYGNAAINNQGDIILTISDGEYCATNYNHQTLELVDDDECTSALGAVFYEE